MRSLHDAAPTGEAWGRGRRKRRRRRRRSTESKRMDELKDDRVVMLSAFIPR